METYKGPVPVFNFLTDLQENGCGYFFYFQPVTGEAQFFHRYSSSMLCFGWRNLPFMFPKPCLLLVYQGTFASHRRDLWK